MQSILATILFRPYVTEDVWQLVTAPAPRTPLGYFELQKNWGGHGQAGILDSYDAQHQDGFLYESMPIKLVSEPRSASNRLLEAFLERLREMVERGRKDAAVALRCLKYLLEASPEPLDRSVADALGGTLGRCLARQGEMSWPLCNAALVVLKDLLETKGSAAAVPSLRERLLKPLATELLHEAALQSQQGLPQQEAWLQDFQQQWMASGQPQGPEPEPHGRARSFRVLLSVLRQLKGKSDMPGKDEAETDEGVRYVPGGIIYLGKMSRVKCHVSRPSASPIDPEESLYLIPTMFTLLLVRPDSSKVFYGEVVISEPLRLVKLKEGDENCPGHALRIEVLAPRSPLMNHASGDPRGYPDTSRTFSGQDFEAVRHGPSVRKEGPVELVLTFADETRRRVASKVITQAQYNVCQRFFDGVLKFLTSVKNGTA